MVCKTKKSFQCHQTLFLARKRVGSGDETMFHVTVFYMASIYFQRVHLDISIGENAVDYAQIAAKEKLSELQLRIRQLLDQIEQITKEQAYQRVHYYVHVRWCLA